MKTKLSCQIALIATVLTWFVSSARSDAQGTSQALNAPSSSSVVGYANTGVGWSFIPNADLLVTGIFSTAPNVNFWQGQSQVIASYNYTGSGLSSGGSGAPFQSIPALHLSAGQLYYMSTQGTAADPSVTLSVYGLNGYGGYTPFTTSSYLTQFASWYHSTAGQWSSTTTPATNNANFLFLGPNFQFQVVPEPSSFALCLLALGTLVFLRIRQPASPTFS
jgi:hypothetical protein